MASSIVARVEGSGCDAMKMISDGLIRDFGAVVIEKWALVIRTYRQPIPPINHIQPEQEEEQQSIQNINKRRRKKRAMRQRAMYTIRHSARPDQLVVMVEDPNAFERIKFTDQQQSTKTKNDENQKKTLDFQDKTKEQQPIEKEKQAPTFETAASSPEDDAPLAVLYTMKNKSSQMEEEEEEESEDDEILPSIPPDHYRYSIVTVPDSFELLLSNTLCSTNPNPPPSSWSPRSNIVVVEGKVWALSSDPINNTHSSHLAWNSNTTNQSRDRQSDWLIRLGKVSNKGAASANVGLPWLMLEIESTCPQPEAGSDLLEALIGSIINYPNITYRTFKPDSSSLTEAGLSKLHDQNRLRMTSAYSILMLAKEERLI